MGPTELKKKKINKLKSIGYVVSCFSSAWVGSPFRFAVPSSLLATLFSPH